MLLLLLLVAASRCGAQSAGTKPGSSANNLDCSAFVSSSKYTATNEPYQSRLHACFQVESHFWLTIILLIKYNCTAMHTN